MDRVTKQHGFVSAHARRCDEDCADAAGERQPVRGGRGASIPRGDLLQTLAPPETPAQGPPSTDVLDELREERL